MSSIVLNGTEIELPDTTTLAISLAAADLHDPSKRTGSYSNNFKLPLTQQLKATIENANKTNSVTNLPYQRMAADIKDGGTIFSKGTAVLREIKDEAELFFLGTNSEWLSQLGDKTLQDLNLSALAHGWTEANVRAYRDNTWTNGFIYPNIDYGFWSDRDLATVNFRELYPAVFVKWLFKAMLEQLGYTISGLWWYATDQDFDSLVIPFSNQKFVTPDYMTLNKSVGNITNNRGYSLPRITTPHLIVNAGLNFDTETDPENQFDLTTFTAQSAGYYNVSFDVSLSLTGTLNAPHTESAYGINTVIEVHINGVLADPLDYATDSLFDATRSNNLTFTKFVFLNAGDTVNLNLYADCNYLDNPSGMSYNVLSGSTFTVAPTYNVIGSANLNLAANLPPVTLKEFVRTISNRYGLVFMTDSWNKNVRVEKFDYIKTRTLQAKDWSDKLDLTEKPRRSYIFKDYAQRNWFKWKADNADPLLAADPDYGNYYIDVANENITAVKDLFTSIFAATKRKTSFSNLWLANEKRTMASIPIYKLKANTIVSWYDAASTYTNSNFTTVVYVAGAYFQLKAGMSQAPGAFDYTKWDYVYPSDVYESKAVVPRIGYIVSNPDADQHLTIDNVAAEVNEPQFYFENLHFQNAITNSYITLSRILDDARIVESLFRLNKADIVNYQETKTETDGPLIPVWYVDENGEGNLYYINEIKQFKVNKKESCWVELVRI